MMVSLIKYPVPLCRVNCLTEFSYFSSSLYLMYFLLWFCIFHLDFEINSHSLLQEKNLFQIFCLFFYFWHILTRNEHNVWSEEPADP